MDEPHNQTSDLYHNAYFLFVPCADSNSRYIGWFESQLVGVDIMYHTMCQSKNLSGYFESRNRYMKPFQNPLFGRFGTWDFPNGSINFFAPVLLVPTWLFLVELISLLLELATSKNGPSERTLSCTFAHVA